MSSNSQPFPWLPLPDPEEIRNIPTLKSKWFEKLQKKDRKKSGHGTDQRHTVKALGNHKEEQRAELLWLFVEEKKSDDLPRIAELFRNNEFVFVDMSDRSGKGYHVIYKDPGNLTIDESRRHAEYYLSSVEIQGEIKREGALPLGNEEVDLTEKTVKLAASALGQTPNFKGLKGHAYLFLASEAVLIARKFIEAEDYDQHFWVHISATMMLDIGEFAYVSAGSAMATTAVAIYFAKAGAMGGTTVSPVVGTVIGAGIGLAVGLLFGAYWNYCVPESTKAEFEKKMLETKRRNEQELNKLGRAIGPKRTRQGQIDFVREFMSAFRGGG